MRTSPLPNWSSAYACPWTWLRLLVNWLDRVALDCGHRTSCRTSRIVLPEMTNNPIDARLGYLVTLQCLIIAAVWGGHPTVKGKSAMFSITTFWGKAVPNQEMLSEKH